MGEGQSRPSGEKLWSPRPIDVDRPGSCTVEGGRRPGSPKLQDPSVGERCVLCSLKGDWCREVPPGSLVPCRRGELAPGARRVVRRACGGYFGAASARGEARARRVLSRDG